MHCALTVECLSLKLLKILYSKTSQTRNIERGTSKELYIYDLLFNLFPTVTTLTYGTKLPGLTKFTFQQGSMNYKKENSAQSG